MVVKSETWLISWMWQLPGPEGLQWFIGETWLSCWMWQLPGPEGLQWCSYETWLSSWMRSFLALRVAAI